MFKENLVEECHFKVLVDLIFARCIVALFWEWFAHDWLLWKRDVINYYFYNNEHPSVMQLFFFIVYIKGSVDNIYCREFRIDAFESIKY